MKAKEKVMNKLLPKNIFKVTSKVFWAVFVVVMLVPFAAVAADVTVNCVTSGGGVSCEAIPAGGLLFNDNNLVPGGTVIRELEINNSHGEACVFEINAKSKERDELNLADRLFTVIRDTSDWYGVSNGSAAANNKTLSDVFAAGPISLGTLAANSITSYEWAVTFDIAAGNEWQNVETVFDFDAVFTCNEGGGGGGDEEDCCPGPDPLEGGGVVLGTTSSSPPGAIAGALFSRFPVTGKVGTAMWLAKDGDNWSRVMSGAIAVVLSLYLVFRARRQKRIVE